MQTISKSGLGAVFGAVALSMATSAFATHADLDCGSGDGDGRKALKIVGLTTEGALVCFNEVVPRLARTIGYVNGLVEDTALVGIDFRAQGGLLYGVGNAGGVYTIDTSSGAATLVNRLTVTLAGDSFGIDFNPAADRLRIVSNTGQNLRHNVDAGGTLSDGALNYTAGVTALGISAAAYTNNDLDATTATTLFDLDTTLDQIAVQSPPNNGSLAPTGKLNVDAAAAAGFDIYTTLSKGVAVRNEAFASLAVGGSTMLYKVNLLTGNANAVGRLKGTVVDIAVPLNQ